MELGVCRRLSLEEARNVVMWEREDESVEWEGGMEEREEVGRVAVGSGMWIDG